VLADCSVPGHPEIFVVGDTACLDEGGKPLPGVAQVAIQQGRYVGRQIAARGNEVGATRAYKDMMGRYESMPMMGGEDALGHMQKIRPDVRVILSSGFSEAEAIHQFAGKGLAGFLEKPYTSARLAESIGKLGLIHSAPV
jgi:NADH dehydrogenase FAD-containing subunit